MPGARSGDSHRRTGAAARRYAMMKRRSARTRATTSLELAGHGASDAVVVEREPVGVCREAANGAAQGIAAVVVTKGAVSLSVCRDEPGDAVTVLILVQLIGHRQIGIEQGAKPALAVVPLLTEI